jgi:hypothetical protein
LGHDIDPHLEVYGKCAMVFTLTTAPPPHTLTLFANVPIHLAPGSGNTRTTHYVIKVSYLYVFAESKQGEPNGSPCGYTITQAVR